MRGDHGLVEIALLDCELGFVFVASTEPVGGYKSGVLFVAQRAVQEKPSTDAAVGRMPQGKYPTAAAIVMARMMKRIAVKYADLGLARRANDVRRAGFCGVVPLPGGRNESGSRAETDEAKTVERKP
jgi:hypothetical protein